MATLIVGLIIAGAAYLAYKLTAEAHKNGKCVGCGSCGKGACPLRGK
ncbi:FeoB-associated Cys-rich membrane protein [Phascolarctobacterium sp.]